MFLEHDKPLFRVVQPCGKDKVRESKIIRERAKAAAAFAEIDRLSAQMLRTAHLSHRETVTMDRPK